MRSSAKRFLLALAPIMGALAIWAGLILALGAEHPVLVVEGHSMEPTLSPGDLILVQGACVEDVRAGSDGDVVVFYKPGSWKGEMIVHRAVEKLERDGELVLRTKGDNVPGPDDWYVTDEELIGKVVFRVPLLGAVVGFLRSPVGVCLVAIIYGLFLFHALAGGGERARR